MVQIFSSEEQKKLYTQKLDLSISILTEQQNMYEFIADYSDTISNYNAFNSYTTIQESKKYLTNAIQCCNNILSLTDNKDITEVFEKILNLENDIYNLTDQIPDTFESIINNLNTILPLGNSIDIRMIILGY